VVIALSKFADFAILQSSFHEIWACRYVHTPRQRLRYAPSDLFETVPRPGSNTELEIAGEEYYAHRVQNNALEE